LTGKKFRPRPTLEPFVSKRGGGRKPGKESSKKKQRRRRKKEYRIKRVFIKVVTATLGKKQLKVGMGKNCQNQKGK